MFLWSFCCRSLGHTNAWTSFELTDDAPWKSLQHRYKIRHITGLSQWPKKTHVTAIRYPLSTPGLVGKQHETKLHHEQQQMYKWFVIFYISRLCLYLKHKLHVWVLIWGLCREAEVRGGWDQISIAVSHRERGLGDERPSYKDSFCSRIHNHQQLIINNQQPTTTN